MNKNGICNIFPLNSMEKYVVNETVTKSLSFSYFLVKKSYLTLKLTFKKNVACTRRVTSYDKKDFPSHYILTSSVVKVPLSSFSSCMASCCKVRDCFSLSNFMAL